MYLCLWNGEKASSDVEFRPWPGMWGKFIENIGVDALKRYKAKSYPDIYTFCSCIDTGTAKGIWPIVRKIEENAKSGFFPFPGFVAMANNFGHRERIIQYAKSTHETDGSGVDYIKAINHQPKR